MTARSRYHPRHLSAARGMVFALTRHPSEAGWLDFSLLAVLRLRETEIAATAWAALTALHPADAEAVCESVMRCAGTPLPPFMDPADDARRWVEMASLAERRSYAAAAVASLPDRDRAALARTLSAGVRT